MASDPGPQVLAAVGRSFFATLPAAPREPGAIRLDIPAGSVLYREGEAPRFGLVIDGLIRIFLTSAEGRQVTVRYARPGSVIGTPTVVGGPVEASAQALTDATLLMLSVETLRSEARQDPLLAWAVAEEVTRRLYEVLEALGGSVFGSVRQRVARHLLDLAADRQHGSTLIAPVSQQALADAVGTAREVVARTLREFRDAGVVDTTRDGVRLLRVGSKNTQSNCGRRLPRHPVATGTPHDPRRHPSTRRPRPARRGIGVGCRGPQNVTSLWL